VCTQRFCFRVDYAAGNVSNYVALGNRAVADLGTGVTSLNGTHDIGFLVSFEIPVVLQPSQPPALPEAEVWTRCCCDSLLTASESKCYMLRLHRQAAVRLSLPVTAAEGAYRYTFLTRPPLPRVRTPVLSSHSCSARRRSASCGTSRIWAHTEAFRLAAHRGGRRCDHFHRTRMVSGVDSISTEMRLCHHAAKGP